MTYTATITSKRQLTIPVEVFKQLGFKTGDQVSISIQDSSAKITPMEKLIDELSGIIKVDKPLSPTRLNKIIKGSKKKYFRENFT